MTRDWMDLDRLEVRRALAVRNLSLGKRGYAMKAIVAYDMLTQDVPALLAVARAAEAHVADQARLGVRLTPGQSLGALRSALDELYAPKRLVAPEPAE